MRFDSLTGSDRACSAGVRHIASIPNNYGLYIPVMLHEIQFVIKIFIWYFPPGMIHHLTPEEIAYQSYRFPFSNSFIIIIHSGYFSLSAEICISNFLHRETDLVQNTKPDCAWSPCIFFNRASKSSDRLRHCAPDRYGGTGRWPGPQLLDSTRGRPR